MGERGRSGKGSKNNVRRDSAYDTTPALGLLPLLARPARGLPPMVRSGRHALAHEHRRTGGSLKDVVDALDLERGALLVGPRTDLLCDTLRVRPGDKVLGVGAPFWWSQVRLATHKDDGYRRAADRAHFFYPLQRGVRIGYAQIHSGNLP